MPEYIYNWENKALNELLLKTVEEKKGKILNGDGNEIANEADDATIEKDEFTYLFFNDPVINVSISNYDLRESGFRRRTKDFWMTDDLKKLKKFIESMFNYKKDAFSYADEEDTEVSYLLIVVNAIDPFEFSEGGFIWDKWGDYIGGYSGRPTGYSYDMQSGYREYLEKIQGKQKGEPVFIYSVVVEKITPNA